MSALGLQTFVLPEARAGPWRGRRTGTGTFFRCLHVLDAGGASAWSGLGGAGKPSLTASAAGASTLFQRLGGRAERMAGETL
jgi:hypothetical protein